MDYSIINKVIKTLLDMGAVKATAFISEKEVVRAKRKTFNGKIERGNIEISLTIGKPNYAEREFIKKCKKVNEPFPIKKIQLKLISK